MKILVIDDHPIDRKLARHVLSAAGHHVSAAEEAEQALDAIKQDRPDIILLDMTLPGMDGLTLVRKLKEDPDTRDIPVVAVTSYPERFTREDAMKVGCDAYLPKPLSIRTLPQTLNDVIIGEIPE